MIVPSGRSPRLLMKLLAELSDASGRCVHRQQATARVVHHVVVSSTTSNSIEIPYQMLLLLVLVTITTGEELVVMVEMIPTSTTPTD